MIDRDLLDILSDDPGDHDLQAPELDSDDWSSSRLQQDYSTMRKYEGDTMSERLGDGLGQHGVGVAVLEHIMAPFFARIGLVPTPWVPE